MVVLVNMGVSGPGDEPDHSVAINQCFIDGPTVHRRDYEIRTSGTC